LEVFNSSGYNEIPNGSSVDVDPYSLEPTRFLEISIQPYEGHFYPSVYINHHQDEIQFRKAD